MIEIRPQPGPQTAFLECDADVVFYGGSAGGGKTYALLINPLYHKDNSKFGCVTFRRTTKQVRSEGGLWDTAVDLYSSIGAKPNGSEMYFNWPSGCKFSFAHMEHEKNRLDWQGAQVPLIQFDELTHFTWKQFTYMLSRNRSMSGVKGQIRATLNPDSDHWARAFIDWWIGEDGFAIEDRSGVIKWFVVRGDDVVWGDTSEELVEQFPDSLPKSFTFIRSKLSDNKILMESDPGYLANLQALSRVDRGQLLDGNWNIRASAGMYFQRSDFEIVDAPPPVEQWVRAWDQAATKKHDSASKKTSADDPDWTVGVKMGKTRDFRWVIEHVERFRENPKKVDQKIQNLASVDGKSVSIRLAQDPGQAGKSQARAQIGMLAGFTAHSKPVTGDKETRAKPLSSQAEAGNVLLVRGPWNEVFLRELENFPDGAHDDQVDAAADAFDELSRPSAAAIVGTYANQ